MAMNANNAATAEKSFRFQFFLVAGGTDKTTVVQV